MDRALTDRETPFPVQASGGAEVVRSRARIDGEPEVILRPHGVRVSGPGRKELAYQRRIADLEEGLTSNRHEQARERRELEVARLIERGTGRLAARLEVEVGRQCEHLAEVRAQGHRLMVALGALQRENEGLREELEAAHSRLARIGPRRTLLRRILGR